jgi:hypothetical protein
VTRRNFAAVLLAIACAISGGAAAFSQPIATPEIEDSSIGYESPTAALEALRNKPGTEISERNGWTIVRDDESASSTAIWLFVPPAHAAYPAVVKRVLAERDGKVYLHTTSLCSGAKDSCDTLAHESRSIDNQVRASSGPPPKVPLATGRYEFQHRFAEHPDIQSIKLIAEVIDDNIVLTNADSDRVFNFGVIEQGTLMWHARTQQWIVGNSEEDRNAEHVGGCSDGPSVIDLVELVYWTC